MSVHEASTFSIFGGLGYPPAHPSRWAGVEGWGMARLTFENDAITITPLWPWRRLLRMPVVRIPLTAIDRVSRITFGVRFTASGSPALDGTRFKRWWGNGQKLETVVELLKSQGISVETMPVRRRLTGFIGDFAVAQRPGWIWRDRGWLAFLESAVGLAIALAVLYALGFFSHAPKLFLVWAAFVVGVIGWGWFAGYRRRKRFLTRRGVDSNAGRHS